MSRWIVAALPAAAVLGTASASATSMPHIVGASSKHGHLVVAAQFGDLIPTTVSAAVKPTTARGRLIRKNVVYTARLDHPKAAKGAVLWRSPVELKPGTYWVQVAGADTGGVTDCPPQLRDCATRRSNVVKVLIKK